MKIEIAHIELPALTSVLEELLEAAPQEIPQDFFEFFKISNGCELRVDDDKFGFDCIRIDSAEEILTNWRNNSLAEVFPELLAFGSDGAGAVLAYDMNTSPPWPIVMHLPGWGSDLVAETMRHLMAELKLRDLKSQEAKL